MLYIGKQFLIQGRIVKVVDKQGDYTLLQFKNMNVPSPYVWAYKAAVEISLQEPYDKISWAWGHYFSKPEDALKVNFERTPTISGKNIEVIYKYKH